MKVEKDDFDDTLVVLDTYNSDLNLVIDPGRYSAHPLTSEGFAFTWAGARATYGITEGKICFEVEVVKHIDCPHLPADEPNPHVVRVGFSVESTSMQLGEEPLSYGYGGTGKKSTNCQFKDFGEEFLERDTVMGLLNLDSDPVQIGFAKNGKFLGWAYKVSKDTLKGQPLFPHVLSKNCSFEVNFGQKGKPNYQPPGGFEEYTYLDRVPVERRIRGVKAPEKREDCEMIMMCGLPGAGKSTWAAEYSEKHPDKKYNILGTNNIIDKMKVMGLPRKRNYAGRWEVLIQMATKCINKMFEIGSKLRRNYVLDQTNVYPTAQRRKMRNFEGFKRRAVIVVPTDLEFRKRINKREREEGKDVPDSAVLEMKANFKLPEVGDIFDEVIFTELQRDEAEKLVRSYNEEGRAAVGPPHKRFHGNNDHSPARRPVQSHQQAGYGTGNFRGQGVNHSGRSGPQGSFGGHGGGCSDFGGRNEFGGREQFGGQNFSGGRGEFGGGRSEFGGGRGEFGGGRGEFGGGRGEFGGGRSEFGGRRSEFGGGRGEFGQSSFGRGEPDGRRDCGRADFEGRGMPSGNFRDCSDYGGAGGPAFNAYNRGGPFSDYKGGMGGEYPNYADVKSGVGGRSDLGPGGYKGRQSDWFGRRPDNDHGVKSYDEKFGNSESSVGYSGPNTQASNDRLQGGSQGNDFGRRGVGLGSSGNFVNRGGSQGGYGGRGGSQGGYGGRGGSQGGYGGKGGSQGGYSDRGGSQGGYGSRAGSQGGYGGRGGSRGGYSGPGGNQSGYDGREGAGASSYGKDGPGAYSNASGSGYGKDNAQSSLYGKDAQLGSYGTETRSPDGYRSGENQSTFKSDSAGGHAGSSSRGSYGGSGTRSGFYDTQHSNYSAGSSHGGYVSDYSTSGHSFSGGQNSRGGSQSNSTNGNEKKSLSQDSSATSVSSQQAISGSQTEQSGYSNYTSPNTGSSGTGTTGVTTFGSYNDENKSHGQATQQQCKGSGSYSQNAEQTSAYNQQQAQATPAVQTWDQTTTATGQTGTATSATQQQAQQVWNQYYQNPQQAQYYSQYYGFPPAAQGYSGSYPAK